MDIELERAIAKLISLQSGDIGVLETVACGKRAIPALRALLFGREPSGLYQPRCRAVDALSALGAQEPLIEFLSQSREISDPVERTGEDAVINAAARALAGSQDIRVFPLLLGIAERRPLPGVIEALGASRRIEALPRLIAALFEDASRPAAELAIRRLGRRARGALLLAGSDRRPSAEEESESSLRRRRSVLSLLIDLGAPTQAMRHAVHELMRDPDPKIAVLSCRLCLAGGPQFPRLYAIRRLMELLASSDWTLDQDIEDCLAENYDLAMKTVAAAAAARDVPEPAYGSAEWRKMRTLRRIAERGPAKIAADSDRLEIAGPETDGEDGSGLP